MMCFSWLPSGRTNDVQVVQLIEWCQGAVVVVVIKFSNVIGGSCHKLAMNSVMRPTGGVVDVCVSGCPSSVDEPLPPMDYIDLAGQASSPSCRVSPLSAISGT
ncbi:unnamed protein product [Lactuca saligna]|uniref:Uncharacterized protein n=1 Tax=Lactuca saligna TaxID=75948 RepID=A0AA35YVN0_LACSI|nr:unnamed protein product [Lactuca saligna]